MCPLLALNDASSIIITAFTAIVRTRIYGKAKIVRVQTVIQALVAISKTIKLAGEPSVENIDPKQPSHVTLL